jgi:predicted ATPase
VETEELLSFLLGTDPDLTPLKRLILQKTEGTPFFMEEVVQTLAEEGVLSGARGQYRSERAPTKIHISPTVQGVLAARIDRLSRAEKELLQHLAVIGREFPVSLVQQVLSLPAEELYRLLGALQTKEFLYEQPALPESEYIFKHALTQEVAYGTVLHERRKALHEQTATVMEDLYRTNLEGHYSELAHHYSRSGNAQKAITYAKLAGEQAVQRSANAEALGYFTTALELLQDLPDTSERTQQELGLQITLGSTLALVKGWAAPEVQSAYSRARALCQQIGEAPQLFQALRGLWSFHLMRTEMQPARELSEQLLHMAQSVQDPALLLDAHLTLGWTLYYLGEFAPSQALIEEGITFYKPQHHRFLAFLYGEDPKVMYLSMASQVLWFLGYPEQALKRSCEALTLVQEVAHAHSQAFALYRAARLHQFRREGQTAQERAEAAITLSSEQGFAQVLSRGTIVRGWALAEQGQGEEGIAQIRQGLAAWQATGAELWQSYHLALLAEAYGKAGQAEAGLAALTEGLATVNKNGERWYEAELYRLKGTLMLQSQVQGLRSHVEKEAEECFHRAIDIARKQQAKSLELRAVMSLGRLWQQQGKKQEAHRLLAEVYGWFTEGFNTKDLQEARALLEELS